MNRDETTKRELFERCVRFEQASARRASTTVKKIELGTVFLNAMLDKVWDRNFLWLGPRASQATASEIIDATEEALSEAKVDHRKLYASAEDISAELAKDLADKGWTRTELVTMVLRDPSVGERSDQIKELDREKFTEFNRVITSEFSESEDVVDQLVQLGVLMSEAANARFFITEFEGKPVASTHLYSDGTAAQIEDVGTLKAYQGRGFSKLLMKHVIADAFERGHDMIFLVAETDDWPKDFYQRLGFEAVGNTLEFKLDQKEDATNKPSEDAV